MYLKLNKNAVETLQHNIEPLTEEELTDIIDVQNLTNGMVAAIFEVSHSTAALWFDSGDLFGYRLPGSNERRIPKRALISFITGRNIPIYANHLIKLSQKPLTNKKKQ